MLSVGFGKDECYGGLAELSFLIVLGRLFSR